MKIDPDLVIEVLGEQVGRLRAEVGMQIEKKMDTAVGLAALDVQGNQIEAIAKVLEQVNTELSGLQGAFKAAHERQDGGEEVNAKAFGAINVSIAAITTQIENIAKNFETVMATKCSVDDMNKVVVNFSDGWEEATAKIEAINATIERHVEAIRASGEQDEAERLNEFTDIVVQRIANLRKDVDAHLAEKLDRADNDVLRSEIEKATDQLSDAISALDNRVTEDDTRSIVADLNGKVDELKRDIDLELAERVKHEDSVAAIEDLQKAIEPRIDDILQRLAGIDADMAEIENGIDQRTDAAIESWRGEFDELKNRLRSTTLSVQEWQEETTREIAKRLAEIKDGVKGETGEKGVDGRDGVRGDKGEKGDRGDPGRDAIPWDHLGTYDPNKAYRFHDVVMKDGGSFLSVVNNNTTVPGESPQWRLMAARGQRGKPGDQGPKGEPGISLAGPVGPQGDAALPFIEIRAEAEHLIFIREDGEVFETSLLPLLAALRGDAKDFIKEQVELAVAKAVKKALEGMKIK